MFLGLKIRKAPALFLIIALVHLVTIFTAPYSIPSGTVEDVSGNANIVDHFDQWIDLNPYAMLVYAIGDFNCHQISDRSFYLNGNQMPVCSRCTGLAIGFFLGSMLFVFTIPDADPFKMALTPILRKKAISISRTKAIILAVIFTGILIAPIAFDGLLQGLTDYESTNTVRLITGLLAGMAVTLAIGVYLESFIYRNLYLNKEKE
jgi:uncharacterized membrane protein